MNISVRQQSRNYQWKVKYGCRAPRVTTRDRRLMHYLFSAIMAMCFNGKLYNCD